MILKEYVKTVINKYKLHTEIAASNYVQNFAGLEDIEGTIKISGEALLDESALDSLILNFLDIPSIPTVTPRQIRLALTAFGVPISTIEAAIDALPEPTRTQARITWEYSVEFQRDNPLVAALAPALGFTPAQLDQLWQIASTI